MPKYLRWLPAVLALAVLLGFLFVNQHQLLEWNPPWQSSLEFSYPQYGIQDTEGNHYVIDNSFRRVMKLNPQGELVYNLQGGDRLEGGFFYAQDMTSDDQGRLYLLNTVLDTKGMFLQREEILVYGAQGGAPEILYQRLHQERLSHLVQRGAIFKPRVQGNRLLWFEVDPNQVRVLSLGLDRQNLEELARVPFPQATQWIADLAWYGDRSFVASLKNGQILAYDWTGSSTLLLDGEETDPDQLAARNWPGRILPWELVNTGDGTLYFVDFGSRGILSLSPQGRVTSILDRESRAAQGQGEEAVIYYRLAQNPGNILSTTDGYSLVLLQSDGEILQTLDAATLPLGLQAMRWLLWTALALSLIFTLYLLFYFYHFVLQGRISLILKQVFILAPLLILAVFLVSNMIIQDFLGRITEEKVNKVSAMAQNFAQLVDPELFEGFDSQRDYGNEDYQEIRRQLHQALNSNRDPWNEDFYFALYRVEEGELQGFMYLNDRIGLSYPFDWFADPQSVYRMAWNGEVASELTTDVSGDWLYAVAPVLQDGRPVALLEVGTDLFSFQETNRALYRRTARWISLVTAGVVLILILFTFLVLQTLRALTHGVNQLAAGRWDTEIQVRSNDEVTDLARTFNQMSESIRRYMEEIETLNKSYRRFVPEQFLTFLGHPSVVNVKLGDQVQKEMTILFSDIRSFTDISEKMSPEENFNFLNSYLNITGPHIRTHGGFIDKYIGDAIMALFPHGEHGADDALKAAIEIKYSLMDFNKEREALGQIPIQVGIGLHTGMLMLGILGEAERMEGTVISDSVNLASRLEALTKHYGASLIVSQSVMDNLSHPERFTTRYLGKVQVKGKTKGMPIHEILDGELPEIREHKLRYKKALETAIALFENQRFDEARISFRKLVTLSGQNKVAQIYKNACDKMLATENIPSHWDGAVTLNFK